jgi:CubicO group peptidase (beta-lactamase class C family)
MNQVIEDKLQNIINNTVDSDRQVRNCLLTISTGDGDFHWSGAVGLADEAKSIKITPDTPFYLASITKLFTAVVVMRLYEDGSLALDDPIARHLPMALIDGIHVYKGVDYTSQIQIQHLLSHTSGIPDYYEKAPKGGRSFFEHLLAEPDREWSVEDTVQWARDKLKPGFTPGKKAEYSDTNFQLLGYIIEAVSDRALHEVYLENIFEPLEMAHSYLHARSEPIAVSDRAPAHFYYKDMDITAHKAFASSWADGGLVSTMDDCLVFLKALNNGKLLKDRATLDLMHNWRPIQFPLKYGFGTMYFKLSRLMSPFSSVPAIWGHSGSTGSFLFFCEELDLYMVGSLNQAKSPGKPFQIMVKIMNLMKNLL